MNTGFSPISTAGYLFISCMGILLLKLSRRYALLPLLACGCYMTLGQIILIGPLHFSIFRIMLLFGWYRIFKKSELAGIKLNYIDKALMTWSIVGSLMYVLNRGMSASAIIDQLGLNYDAVGVYFLLRALMPGIEDTVRAVRLLELVMVPLAVLFVVEFTTGKNMFSVFGGVPQFAGIRDGALRCQGPFRHPILAGTFAATAMPLFVGLWGYNRKRRLLAASSIAATAVIVYCSSSSGPIIAYLTGMVGLLCWVFRSRIKVILWSLFLITVGLQMTMKTPVWHVLGSMGDVIGMGTGWYRSRLIDAAVEHFHEWWLMGTTYTADWMPDFHSGLGFNPNNIDASSADITNQFIAEGIRGGLLSLLLFVWLIVKCFKTAGTAINRRANLSTNERFVIWATGCALLAHIASFISVTYFDQIIIFWYMLIAMIAALANSVTVVKTGRVYCLPRCAQLSNPINPTL